MISKVLITGSNGLLGSSLQNNLPNSSKIFFSVKRKSYTENQYTDFIQSSNNEVTKLVHKNDDAKSEYNRKYM